MDGGDYASFAAAIVAAFSAWAVARSSANGNRLAKELETRAAIEAKEIESAAAKESTRSQAETDAYARARAFDTETIERQNRKIESLEAALGERESELGQVRTDNNLLHADVRLVSQENRDLQTELASAHRVIDNLRNYIRYTPLDIELPTELESGPERTVRVDPKVQKVIAEVIDDYDEPGTNYTSD